MFCCQWNLEKVHILIELCPTKKEKDITGSDCSIYCNYV